MKLVIGIVLMISGVITFQTNVDLGTFIGGMSTGILGLAALEAILNVKI